MKPPLLPFTVRFVEIREYKLEVDADSGEDAILRAKRIYDRMGLVGTSFLFRCVNHKTNDWCID